MQQDTVAEWLRRRPAKPMCTALVGSNSIGVGYLVYKNKLRVKNQITSKKLKTVKKVKSWGSEFGSTT